MRGRFGKFIDDQIKMCEMSGCRLDGARRHKPAIVGGLEAVTGIGNHHGHAKAAIEPAAKL